MKKIITVALMAFSSMAFATSPKTEPTTINQNVTSLQLQKSTSIAGAASSSSSNQSVTVTEAAIPTHTSSDVELKNVPSILSPSLTSSNDTCMGSSSAGIAGAGFGVSLGSSWADKNCVMLKNSRELWNMGFKAAAMARMCMDAMNKQALEMTGYVCPVKEEPVEK